MFVIDFETRSRCDLKTAGLHNYLADPATEIVCLAGYCTETEYKQIWWPATGPLPEKFRYHLENANFVAAHNAEFDQGIYEFIGVPDHGFPEITRERWYCTAAQCRVNALPASLDDAAMALKLKIRKDNRGKQLIRQLSIPNKDTGEFNDDPVLHQEFREYCMKDVEVTVQILKNSRLMTQNEHADWLKTCEINERGIRVDLELATLSLKYAEIEQGEIATELKRLTDSVVDRHTQTERIKKYLVGQLGELHPIIQEMTVYKAGVAKLSLDKNIRRNIRGKIADFTIQVDDKFGDIVQLLDDGNASSVSKFKRMLAMADPEDHRVRGAFVFAGASQTLRYASRGVQVHNMKRDCWDASSTEALKRDMREGAEIGTGKGVMQTLAKAMRPAIIPEDGKVFVVGDWSSIEARCLHWGTDTLQGDQKLMLFEDGVDVYQETADELNLADRQQGKVVELSAGYQGHANAFQAMARNYGVKVGHDEAGEIVNKWRKSNWWVVDFWHKLEQAAKSAIGHPNEYFSAGMVKYIFVPDMMNGTLLCVMPGNHVLHYPEARIQKVKTPWGGEQYSVTAIKAAFKPKADAKGWPRTSLYGGLFCENFCQGFSAAILRNALRGLSDVTMHVHDEIVLEVPEEIAEYMVGVLKLAMVKVPDWADGLPLNAEPVIMTRYGK